MKLIKGTRIHGNTSYEPLTTLLTYLLIECIAFSGLLVLYANLQLNPVRSA